jgi:type VII secretion-associated serine protease mycosin
VRTTRKAAVFLIAATATIGGVGSPANADRIRDMQWHIGYLNLDQAHKITDGSGITVAIPDTGVSRHVDIARNLKRGTDTVPGGDGAGQKDQNGHGTQMAGLIAGHGHGSNAGVIGVAPGAEIAPIKITDAAGSDQGLSAAIEWAAGTRADIISVSIATGPSRGLNTAIKSAIRADSVVVAGAGNKSSNPRFGYPAALPGVLAVGAIGRNGEHADLSITGPKVEICAPGIDIVSTDLDNKYAKSQGTSDATAIVSGAAALVRAKFPELSAPEVIHRLTATAKDNGPPGRDDQCGYGVLDIVKALTADVPPLSPSAGSGSGSSAPTGGASTSAGASAPVGGGASAGASPAPEPSGSIVPVVAGIGAAIIALGTVLAFLVRRRRRSESPAPPA